MSENFSRRAETASQRLSKAEANAESKINGAMGQRFSRLERAVRSNWSQYQNLDQLPRQRAIALSRVLDKNLDLVPNTEKTFRELYSRSQSEGASLAKDLLKQVGITNIQNPSSTNDFVDFWTSDSAGRLGDWGTAFKRDATAIFELGMSQNWSANQVNNALMARFGKLQQQSETIVRTGSVSTLNSTTNAYYNANSITLVQWQTSRIAADRTCNYCSPRNGNVYYIKDITYPLHPRERCTIIPVNRRNLLYNSDRDYWRSQKAAGLEELRNAGGSPNYGPAPFEKKAGRLEAPKAAWQPDKGYSYGEKSKTRRVVDE